jgi:hypothetical protein
MTGFYQKPKVLFIGGSVNQTSICHEIARHLEANCNCFFTPYYTDHPLAKKLMDARLLDFTTLGGKFRRQTEDYLKKNRLPVDYGGRLHDYDLVVTTSDLLIQDNIRGKKIILVQEGMTDPENPATALVKFLRLPPWMALNTSAFGLSGAYDYFCVASQGYKQLFIRKGVASEKIIVTGIPNFDNAVSYLDNDFPHKNFVLVATSDLRETGRLDRRTAFIRSALEIAAGRQLIFKLHPNEKKGRAEREIRATVPNALIFSEGNTSEMVANCDVLITQYSSVAYIGLALKKEVHSYFNVAELRKLFPIQNGGHSGRIIAALCVNLLTNGEKVG